MNATRRSSTIIRELNLVPLIDVLSRCSVLLHDPVADDEQGTRC